MNIQAGTIEPIPFSKLKLNALKQTYTVMLLYPDYATDNYGQEIFITYVEADSGDDALALARQEALDATKPNDWLFEDADDRDPEDFHVLGVMKGAVEFVKVET